MPRRTHALYSGRAALLTRPFPIYPIDVYQQRRVYRTQIKRKVIYPWGVARDLRELLRRSKATHIRRQSPCEAAQKRLAFA
jgi:hypothetical protein